MTINLSLPTSWKTTVAGILAAVGSYLAMFPNTLSGHPNLANLAKFIAVGGIAGLGFTAKDSDVTGGRKVNGSNDPIVVAGSAVVNR